MEALPDSQGTPYGPHSCPTHPLLLRPVSVQRADHELRGMRAAECLAEACELALHPSIHRLLASERQSAAVQQLLNMRFVSSVKRASEA